MILFDDVVEVFDLTDLDARLMFGVVAGDRLKPGGWYWSTFSMGSSFH
jgi:hypothetical protein